MLGSRGDFGTWRRRLRSWLRAVFNNEHVAHAFAVMEGAADLIGAGFHQCDGDRFAGANRAARITGFELAVALCRYREVGFVGKTAGGPEITLTTSSVCVMLEERLRIVIFVPGGTRATASAAFA